MYLNQNNIQELIELHRMKTEIHYKEVGCHIADKTKFNVGNDHK